MCAPHEIGRNFWTYALFLIFFESRLRLSLIIPDCNA